MTLTELKRPAETPSEQWFLDILPELYPWLFSQLTIHANIIPEPPTLATCNDQENCNLPECFKNGEWLTIRNYFLRNYKEFPMSLADFRIRKLKINHFQQLIEDYNISPTEDIFAKLPDLERYLITDWLTRLFPPPRPEERANSYQRAQHSLIGFLFSLYKYAPLDYRLLMEISREKYLNDILGEPDRDRTGDLLRDREAC